MGVGCQWMATKRFDCLVGDFLFQVCRFGYSCYGWVLRGGSVWKCHFKCSEAVKVPIYKADGSFSLQKVHASFFFRLLILSYAASQALSSKAPLSLMAAFLTPFLVLFCRGMQQRPLKNSYMGHLPAWPGSFPQNIFISWSSSLWLVVSLGELVAWKHGCRCPVVLDLWKDLGSMGKVRGKTACPDRESLSRAALLMERI